ncbi:hypothetical protein FH972_012882 [Carpinus fangiana]|uniref:Uncharacterized protein n=1 Tax=Carpinus fangiana TaxID=176857 RepID=A0A5N6R894_9ROSI|nr:hypothetical protein FH972_012882 [Carpinus fangiana]
MQLSPSLAQPFSHSGEFSGHRRSCTSVAPFSLTPAQGSVNSLSLPLLSLPCCSPSLSHFGNVYGHRQSSPSLAPFSLTPAHKISGHARWKSLGFGHISFSQTRKGSLTLLHRRFLVDSKLVYDTLEGIVQEAAFPSCESVFSYFC